MEEEASRKEVRLYFTIYAPNDSWKPIAHELSDATILSGLYDRADRIIVYLGGGDIGLFSQGGKVEVVQKWPAGFNELLCLERLWNDAKAGDFAAMYAHTKGICSGAHEHRKFLIGNTIWRWRESLAALADAQACGTNWKEEPCRHFCGNMWWADSMYLRTLCEPEKANACSKEARHRAEFWIGTGGPRVIEIASTGKLDFYHWRMPDRLFTKGV